MSSRLRHCLGRLRDYVQLTRVELYRTFSQLVLGFTLGGGLDLAYLGVTLLILAPGIYGGLYTLNGAHDYRADRRHPTKRARPVASGRVSPRAATRLGVGLIGAGLIGAALFDHKVFALALLFVALNLAYTYRLKAVPYVEILLNTVTHPLRFVGGLWLAGSAEHGPVVVASLLGGLVITTLKRIKERREAGLAARPVLRQYAPGQLEGLVAFCLLGLAALWPWTAGWDQLLTGAWLAIAVSAVIVYQGLPRLQRLAAQLRR